MNSAKMRSHMHGSGSTTRSCDSYTERRQAEVAQNVHDMNHRHSVDRSSAVFLAGRSREQSLSGDAVVEGMPTEGEARRGSLESVSKSLESAESRRVSNLAIAFWQLLQWRLLYKHVTLHGNGEGRRENAD